MKMPHRADFESGESYLSAMTTWMKESEKSYQRLLGMFEVANPQLTKPDWVTSFQGGCEYGIRNVSIDAGPDKMDDYVERVVKPALNNLSANAMEDDMDIVQICYGPFDGKEVWSCYAQLKAA